MQELKHKQRLRGVLYSPFTAIILIILIILFARSTSLLYQRSAEAKAGREHLESEIADIKAREGFLRRELSALESQSGLEERLRQKFNIKREGEEVAVIVKPEESQETKAAPTNKQWFSNLIVQIVDFFQ